MGYHREQINQETYTEHIGSFKIGPTDVQKVQLESLRQGIWFNNGMVQVKNVMNHLDESNKVI